MTVTVLSGAPAQADSSRAAHRTASTSPDPRYAALAEAKSTGKPVDIASMTTSDSQTQALPNGSLATTSTMLPTRMRTRAGAWEEIDPTLRRNPDGSISTTATPNTLTLSGGGTGALVRAAEPTGGAMALSLPVSLPAPTLDGASATYANIYPGIDLTVTAQPTGGFSEVFEVEDAAAEAEAQSLKFSTALSGLKLSQHANGSLSVVDSATGRTFMTAPSAIMWDSATDGAGADTPAADFKTVTNRGSSAAGPGLRAHSGPLHVTASAGALDLDGAVSQLGTAPVYPLYLDPTWTEPYQSGGTNNYSEVQSGCAGVANWDDVTQPGVGYNDINGDGDCPGYGAYRTYFDLGTSNLNSSDTIVSSIMKINEVFSADDSCDEGTQTITVKWTDGISSSTDWSSQPTVISTLPDPTAMETDGNGDGTMCSGGTVAGNFPLTSAISSNAANNGSHITFGLFGDESGSWMSLERFNDNPSVYTVYDIPPNAPGTPSTSPAPVTGISDGRLATTACPTSSSAPGWLGIGNIGGSDVSVLSAQLTDPIAAAQMNATFTLKNVTANSTAVTYTSSGYVTSGANVSVQTSGLTNGDEYSWSATASDQFYSSKSASTTCYFKVDTTPPTNPAISNASWPTLSSGTSSSVYPGTQGSFTAASTDTISGVDGYYWSIDAAPVPSEGGSFQSGTTIDYTPADWGAHTLYVQALDNAGNLSAVSSYSFYVPWSPASTGVTGAVDGGTVPDFITNPSTGSNAGALVMVPGDSSPDATPTPLIAADESPDGTSWADFQVTHDGSLTNHPGFDDLWAFGGDNPTDNLYLYLNNLTSTPFATSTHNDITKPEIDDDTYNNAFNQAQNDPNACVTTSSGSCSGYDDKDWTETTQILAGGDLYAGDPNTAANIGAVDNGVPGLLTVENGALWYYQGQAGANYLGIVEQLGTSGWNGTTLIGTTTTGSGSSTQTYLWARLNSNGAIMSYPITFDTAANGYNLMNLGTPTGGKGTAVSVPDAANNDAQTVNDLPASAYPQLYAWDMHHTGNSDLLATTPSGSVVDWPASGPGQFGSPESLSASTSTGPITLASTGTDYPSGTTWDDGTATLTFNQGQLSVVLDSTGKVVSQYGQYSPSAYLTLQTDGNLVIYPNGGGTALWALNRDGQNAAFADGDALELSGSTLTLDSSTGTTLWTAESSVSSAAAITGEAAFTAVDGDAALTIGADTIDTGEAVATGTSPSVADIGTNDYEVTFQGSNGDLDTYNYDDGAGTFKDTGDAMKPGTSPSTGPLPSNGWITAYQASNGAMEVLSTAAANLITTGDGMEAGSSPDICTNSTGGWEVAFQNSSTNLATYNGNGTTVNTTLGLNTASSPTISCLNTAGVEVAFEANTNDLWEYNGTAGVNLNLGMASGTSPCITDLPNGQWEVAFQANTGALWTTGAGHGGDTGEPMASGTSPSITSTSGLSYALAWTSSTNTLTTMNTAPTGSPVNTGNVVGTGTSPTIAP